jgi:hypothetical protein
MTNEKTKIDRRGEEVRRALEEAKEAGEFEEIERLLILLRRIESEAVDTDRMGCSRTERS